MSSATRSGGAHSGALRERRGHRRVDEAGLDGQDADALACSRWRRPEAKTVTAALAAPYT